MMGRACNKFEVAKHRSKHVNHVTLWLVHAICKQSFCPIKDSFPTLPTHSNIYMPSWSQPPAGFHSHTLAPIGSSSIRRVLPISIPNYIKGSCLRSPGIYDQQEGISKRSVLDARGVDLSWLCFWGAAVYYPAGLLSKGIDESPPRYISNLKTAKNWLKPTWVRAFETSSGKWCRPRWMW